MADLLERVRASLAGRYTIERELGAGGLATVYAATIGTERVSPPWARLALSLAAALACLAVPHRARAQGSDKLFDSKSVLELRIATDLRALMQERDSLKLKPHPGTLTYVAIDGQRVSIETELKLRGHWRRQRKNCDFAPIEVHFPKGARSGTIFQDQGDLKLVTHCRSKNPEFEQYVLREYLVYQLANLLTPVNLRARLVRATYVDTVGKQDSLTQNAFFIENERRAAARNNAEVLKVKGATWDQVDPALGALVSAFEYMIGSSDWSLVGLHNIVLFEQKGTGVVWPMAYDFDWTGIVWTRYSFPDSRLPIASVRQRLYRGICRTPEEWAPTLATFQAKQTELYAVYDNLPELDPKYIKQTRQYLDEFFEVISNPRKMKREMIDTCRRGV